MEETRYYSDSGNWVTMSTVTKIQYIPKVFTELAVERLNTSSLDAKPLTDMQIYQLGLLASQQEYKFKLLLEKETKFKKLTPLEEAQLNIFESSERELLGYTLDLSDMTQLLEEAIKKDYPLETRWTV